MTSIPFKTIESQQTYSEQAEGLSVIETESTVKVIICQRFPTPGYSMGVNKVVKDDDIYTIYLSVIPPKPGAILLQVITYKSIGIEIDKEDLGAPPYKFKLAGNSKISVPGQSIHPRH